MRRWILFALPLLAFACDDGRFGRHGFRGESANQVVFGINQTSAAMPTREITGGYQFVSLAQQGGSTPVDFSEDDGTTNCTFERFDQRVGAAHVDGGGVAVFSGGKLPSGGFPILANQTDKVRADGIGWATGDYLDFDVTGFALPNIRRQTLRAPAAELTISSVTPKADGTLLLKDTDDIDVSWTSVAEDRPSRIMLSIESDEGTTNAGGGVRCFSPASAGHASIPALWVQTLLKSIDATVPKKGKITVSTHRQLTLRAPGDWTIYAVATTEHYEQAWATTETAAVDSGAPVATDAGTDAGGDAGSDAGDGGI